MSELHGISRNVKYDRDHKDRAKAERLTLFTIDMRGPAIGTVTMQGFLFTRDEVDEVVALITKLGTRKEAGK